MDQTGGHLADDRRGRWERRARVEGFLEQVLHIVEHRVERVHGCGRRRRDGRRLVASNDRGVNDHELVRETFAVGEVDLGARQEHAALFLLVLDLLLQVAVLVLAELALGLEDGSNVHPREARALKVRELARVALERLNLAAEHLELGLVVAALEAESLAVVHLLLEARPRLLDLVRDKRLVRAVVGRE
ncbi:hypothetical protein SPRG_11647 [Saprolegnia parasitica CBS 223.65]|uniref:Uncharacterized protein n=1 Tax=Saprolegnia parasitica (strain CBS 223.65) TaxID=695850 RepID=A0A067BYJ0_SAPPC|nr:hypothetical protein SPRG_11647 [Saprolegnia parasitica CBS 223.65]KDO23333.1 hypothetical protein SPRG_11647 [Saprolegnia parasitica CBS 223.65]|eukprot:XP_012205985.1 hypothetical protein SPRG_11647 [Saprolegnia parasitica CBS 223.65]